MGIITLATIIFRGLKRIEYGANTAYQVNQSFFTKSNLKAIFQQYRFTSYDAGLLIVLPTVILALDSGKSYVKLLRVQLSTLYAAWLHHEKLAKENQATSLPNDN